MPKLDRQIRIIVAVLALCTVLAVAQDPCTSPISLYSPSNNRSSYFTVNYVNVLCDINIDTNQWVSFYGPGEQSLGYKIPEICIVPYHCGTLIPIYIDGHHPNASYPGPVDALACHSSYPIPDCCGWSARIQIKWCSPGFYVYRLQRPESCHAAYCFDNIARLPDPPYPLISNPKIRNPFISDFKLVNWSLKRTDGTYGLYTFNATKFSIGCTVNFADSFTMGNSSTYGSLMVEVDLVVVEGQNVSSLIPQPFKLTSPTQTEFLIGEQYIAGNLDKPIMCSSKSYWSNQPDFHSPILYSRKITLEFQIKTDPYLDVSEDSIIILDEKDTLELWLEPNFPVTFGHCFDQSVWPTCQPYRFVLKPGDGVNAVLQDCVIEIYPDVDFPAEVVHPKSIIYISAPQTLGTRSTPFSVVLEFLPVTLFPATNSIFNYQYTIPSIYITITDTEERPVCFTHSDPHILPFHNGPLYDMLTQIGDFYLVKLMNSSRTFEIQVQHRKCLTTWNDNMCNCGVFIREGNNVVGINNCGNSGFMPRIVHYQTVTHDSNGVKLPSPTLEETGTDEWHVTLLSGVKVIVTTLFGNLNVQVTGLAHEEYDGLCAPGATLATALRYRVPDEESLFINIAECVDEDIPISRCRPDCERTDTTSNTILDVCRTTVPVTTLTVKTECNRNVTVTGLNTGVLPPLNRKKRSTDDTNDPYSIVVPAYIFLSPIAPGISDAIINTRWPTPTKGITELEAASKCQSVFEKSPAFSLCDQNTTNLMNSCLLDIQVSESLEIAEMYLSQFNLECQHAVESSIVQNANGSSANGAGKLLQEIKSVLCPADCKYKDDVRGICVNGTCQCYEGFKGIDCSIKIGEPPIIKNFYQDVIDYTSGNSTTKDGVLILIAAENVDYVNATEISCRFAINSAIGPDSQKIAVTYPGVRLLGGLVACFIKPDKSLTGALYHVNVSLSNDGVSYSTEESIVVHDGNCTQCTVTNFSLGLNSQVFYQFNLGLLILLIFF